MFIPTIYKAIKKKKSGDIATEAAQYLNFNCQLYQRQMRRAHCEWSIENFQLLMDRRLDTLDKT